MSQSDENWTIPVLDRAGQQVFWSRQAQNYDTSKMTIDNEGELDLVAAICRHFSRSGHVAEDVVTLGGAVGSREPKIVLDTLAAFDQFPNSIYFNDLSPEMVRTAEQRLLRSTRPEYTRLHLLPGAIHEVIEKIPAMPRRVIIGVYKSEPLIVANPHHGHPTSGLDTYDEYADTVGSRITVTPMHLLHGESYVSLDTSVHIQKGDTQEVKRERKKEVGDYLSHKALDALRVVGTHENQEGYFLSHWFTEKGILGLVKAAFSIDRLSSLSIMPCAKGFVLCIDPVEKPRGIVTILNNVIGNIIPNEQIATLRAIDKMSS